MACTELNTPEGLLRIDVTNGVYVRTLDGEVVEERPVTDEERVSMPEALADQLTTQQEVINQLLLDALGF